jgi:hypothetical protein
MGRAIVVFVVAQGLAGCGGSPTGPQPRDPVPPGTPMSVTEISPNAGSTDGGTALQITGTGFERGVTVKVGGIEQSIHLEDARTIYLRAPGHAAGDVDVVVTKLDGQTGTLTRGYTYALPESFDFNGDWGGDVTVGDGIGLRFTIRNDTLTSISCGSSAAIIVTPPALISNGQFSFSSGETISISGRILSASQAGGAIEIAPCVSGWFAIKR